MVDLKNIKDAPKFSLEGQEIQAKVVSVYDGDTIRCIFPLHDTFYKWSCRLVGIDTPEIRTRCKEVKKYGYHVRDKLREKILDKIVKLKCGEFDKYGRLLVTVICEENCCVNQWLIDNKYAFSYDGGKKKCWKEYFEKNNSQSSSPHVPPGDK